MSGIAPGEHVAPSDPRAVEAAHGLEHGRREGSRFRHDMSHEQILRAAARRGFHVSPRYREATLGKKAYTLKKRGCLVGGRGKRFGDGWTYNVTPLGLAVLRVLEDRKRAENT